MLRVKDWDRLFEAPTRRPQGGLKWLPLRIDWSGEEHRTLIHDHADGELHMYVWLHLMRLAARGNPRGTLSTSSGAVLDLARIAKAINMRLLPLPTVETAVERLLNLGWLEEVDPCQPCAELAPTRQDPTRPDKTKTGKDSDLHPSSDDFDFDANFLQVWETYPEKGRIKQPFARKAYNDALLPAVDRDDLHVKILAAITGKWATSKQWRDGIICGLDMFLRGMRWLESPEQADGEREFKKLW